MKYLIPNICFLCTCSTYVADVCLTKQSRARWYIRMNSYPALSYLFALPLAGWLTSLDVVFPYFVVGCITLVEVLLIVLAMAESPSWLRSSSSTQPIATENAENTHPPRQEEEGERRLPLAAYLLLVESFLWGVSLNGEVQNVQLNKIIQIFEKYC